MYVDEPLTIYMLQFKDLKVLEEEERKRKGEGAETRREGRGVKRGEEKKKNKEKEVVVKFLTGSNG